MKERPIAKHIFLKKVSPEFFLLIFVFCQLRNNARISFNKTCPFTTANMFSVIILILCQRWNSLVELSEHKLILEFLSGFLPSFFCSTKC